MKIIPQNTENLLWNKLYNEYKFTPKIHGQFEWIKIPNENKTYHKDTPWTDEQEYLINSFWEVPLILIMLPAHGTLLLLLLRYEAEGVLHDLFTR